LGFKSVPLCDIPYLESLCANCGGNVVCSVADGSEHELVQNLKEPLLINSPGFLESKLTLAVNYLSVLFDGYTFQLVATNCRIQYISIHLSILHSSVAGQV
jgi:hypothetical protein